MHAARVRLGTGSLGFGCRGGSGTVARAHGPLLRCTRSRGVRMVDRGMGIACAGFVLSHLTFETFLVELYSVRRGPRWHKWQVPHKDIIIYH